MSTITTNNADEIIMNLQNSSKKITPYEEAIMFNKLEALGWSQTKIANSVGRTCAHVSNMLKVSKAPKSVHDAMTDGVITPTTILKIMQRYGESSEQVIIDSITKAKSLGRKKVTDKIVDATVENRKLAPMESRYQKTITRAITECIDKNKMEHISMLRKVRQIVSVIDVYKDSDELVNKLAEIIL